MYRYLTGFVCSYIGQWNFDLYIRRTNFERFYSGAKARARFPDDLVRLIENGHFTESGIDFLPEIMIHFYYEYTLTSNHYPR